MTEDDLLEGSAHAPPPDWWEPGEGTYHRDDWPGGACGACHGGIHGQWICTCGRFRANRLQEWHDWNDGLICHDCGWYFFHGPDNGFCGCAPGRQWDDEDLDPMDRDVTPQWEALSLFDEEGT